MITIKTITVYECCGYEFPTRKEAQLFDVKEKLRESLPTWNKEYQDYVLDYADELRILLVKYDQNMKEIESEAAGIGPQFYRPNDEAQYWTDSWDHMLLHVDDLIDHDKKIHAIKLVRASMSPTCNLKDAKDWVEARIAARNQNTNTKAA